MCIIQDLRDVEPARLCIRDATLCVSRTVHRSTSSGRQRVGGEVTTFNRPRKKIQSRLTSTAFPTSDNWTSPSTPFLLRQLRKGALDQLQDSIAPLRSRLTNHSLPRANASYGTLERVSDNRLQDESVEASCSPVRARERNREE